MTFELQAVLWTTMLLFLLLMFQGGLVPAVQGLGWGLGSRDEPRDKSAMQGRAARTIANHIESMLLFVPLILVAHLIGLSTALTIWGAGLYLIGRAAFAMLYLFGVPVLRSGAWAVSVLGIMLVGFEVVRAALL